MMCVGCWKWSRKETENAGNGFQNEPVLSWAPVSPVYPVEPVEPLHSSDASIPTKMMKTLIKMRDNKEINKRV